MKAPLIIISTIAIARIAGAQPSIEDVMGGLDTVNKGASQAGDRDCDKAERDQQAHFAKNMNNPQAAVFGGAKLACSYLEKIAWKVPDAKAAPSPTSGKDLPGSGEVTSRASGFWAASDDMNYVKVLSGGVLGQWQQKEMSDAPGVPSSRAVNVFHVIVASIAHDGVGCFVVYGQLAQKNANHPDPTRPPVWTASEYQASDYQRAQKIACPKGAKPPAPPKQ